MLTSKTRALIVIAWTALWMVALWFYYHNRREAELEKQRLTLAAAVQSATEREKTAASEKQRIEEKIKEQAKRMAALQLSKGFPGELTPEEETSPVSGLLGPRPPADQPIPPIVSAVENYIATHALTATSIDKTPYAVIDQHRYRVGDRVPLGADLGMFVCSIKDGFVIFSVDDRKYKMLLAQPK